MAGVKESLNPRAGVWVFGPHHGGPRPRGPQGSSSDPALQAPFQEPRPGCWRLEVLGQGSASLGSPLWQKAREACISPHLLVTPSLQVTPRHTQSLVFPWHGFGSPSLTVVGSHCLLSGSPLECSMRLGASIALRLRAWGGVDTHGALSDHLLSRCLGQPALCWPGPRGGPASTWS